MVDQSSTFALCNAAKIFHFHWDKYTVLNYSRHSLAENNYGFELVLSKTNYQYWMLTFTKCNLEGNKLHGSCLHHAECFTVTINGLFLLDNLSVSVLWFRTSRRFNKPKRMKAGENKNFNEQKQWICK